MFCLHNFLLKANTGNKGQRGSNYCPPNFADQEGPHGVRLGDWRSQVTEKTGLQPLSNVGSNNYSMEAKNVRNMFKYYFNSEEGSVQWQEDIVMQII